MLRKTPQTQSPHLWLRRYVGRGAIPLERAAETHIKQQQASISAEVVSAAAAATADPNMSPEQLASYNSAAYAAATSAMAAQSQLIDAAMTSVLAAQSSASVAIDSLSGEAATATGEDKSSLTEAIASITSGASSRAALASTLSHAASSGSSGLRSIASSAAKNGTHTSTSDGAAPTQMPLAAGAALGAVGIAVLAAL